MNDAGKVAFTPKGDYSSAVTYEYLDTVVYNGNAYAALKTTTGNAPTDSDTDENWKLLARGGESVPMASETTPGVVKASNDIGVSDDGSMVLKTDFTQGSYENLIPYPYYHTTVTRSGITFTDNGDGTITANGTATNTADFYCQNFNEKTFNVPAGIYTMSGCPEGGSTSTFYQILGKINDDGNAERVLTNTEVQNVEFTKNTDVYVIIRILKNTTVSNLTFKPMLEVGSIAHAYKPYSLSNAGLQKQIDNDVVHNFNISSSSAITETGKYVLDATEKNASVEGTLANKIGTINTNLKSYEFELSQCTTAGIYRINKVIYNEVTKEIEIQILYEGDRSPEYPLCIIQDESLRPHSDTYGMCIAINESGTVTSIGTCTIHENGNINQGATTSNTSKIFIYAKYTI